MGDGKILPKVGKFFASATERTQSWNGIQQDITGRVQRKLAYEVTALVRIFGNNVTSSNVRATLWVQNPDLREQYIGIAKLVSILFLSFFLLYFTWILRGMTFTVLFLGCVCVCVYIYKKPGVVLYD